MASLDFWVDYLGSPNAPYPIWIKYYVLRSVLSMGQYSIEQNSFTKRSKGTVHLFPDLNQEALAHVLDAIMKKYVKKDLQFHENDFINDQEFQKILQGENFSKLYAYAYDKCVPTASEKFIGVEGKWIKYNKGSDHIPLVQSLKNKKTGWCTAGESTAELQLSHGDFYVFYSNDSEGNPTIPRAAIRMQGDKIGEVRGVAPNQNLDTEIGPVVERKLSEFHGSDLYKKKAHDMKELTLIYNKVQKKQELVREELIFLYQINSKIDGFGWRKDPRIKELLKKRDRIYDYSVIYNIPKELIVDNPQKVTEMTRMYVGELSTDTNNMHGFNDVFFVIHDDDVEYEYKPLKSSDYKILDHRKSPIIINTNLDFSNSPIELLPYKIIFNKNADFHNCIRLKNLPEKMTINGHADFRNTPIFSIPEGTIFRGSANFSGCQYLSILPKNIRFPSDASFNKTLISSIPVGVEFGGDVSFRNCKKLESFPANSLFTGVADFSGSALKSVPEFAVFEQAAFFDNCAQLIRVPENVKFNSSVSFENSGLQHVPNNIAFHNAVNFSGCKKLFVLPARTFESLVSFKSTSISEIPSGVIFKFDVSFFGCNLLTKISADVKFDADANFIGCEKLSKLPMNINFGGDADFAMCISLEEIPHGATFNGSAGFDGCVKLQRISKKVVFNGDVNFSNCTSLMTVSPDVVFNGGADFHGCRSLTNITIAMLKKMKEEGKIKGRLKLPDHMRDNPTIQ